MSRVHELNADLQLSINQQGDITKRGEHAVRDTGGRDEGSGKESGWESLLIDSRMSCRQAEGRTSVPGDQSVVKFGSLR